MPRSLQRLAAKRHEEDEANGCGSIDESQLKPQQLRFGMTLAAMSVLQKPRQYIITTFSLRFLKFFGQLHAYHQYMFRLNAFSVFERTETISQSRNA